LAGRRFANREPSIASQCGLVSAFQLRRGWYIGSKYFEKNLFQLRRSGMFHMSLLWSL